MSPATHLLFGWAIAQCGDLDRRDRTIICLAGIAPDIDGLGMFVDFATRSSANPTDYWGTYHHILGHNIGLCLACMCIAAIWAKRSKVTIGLVALSVHVHLFCDLIGGRGPASTDYPDGYQWPMPYLYPFSDAWIWEWSGQWSLNAWQNFVCTGVLLVLMFYWAWRRGFSPLSIISLRADKGFVYALRQRFGMPKALRDETA